MNETIFFGNGINRLTKSNPSWHVLLTKLKEKRIFKDDKLPNTMIYERIILDRPKLHLEILKEEFDVKSQISNFMINTAIHPLYQQLHELKAQNYLTTNYDNSFIDTIQNHFNNQIRVENLSTEGIYSLRREKRIYKTRKEYKSFWQLHGEIERPASIMLGLDHYCGSIGKIDSYIKGGYEYRRNGKQIRELSITQKLKDTSFTKTSWVELFFNSNIHILGFTLDYSETDLWWIINKRARMLKDEKILNHIKNKIVFYCDEIDSQKKGLLESMGVKVNIVERTSTFKNNYEAHYEGLMKTLRRRIK
jgi:hypothetical protein